MSKETGALVEARGRNSAERRSRERIDRKRDSRRLRKAPGGSSGEGRSRKRIDRDRNGCRLRVRDMMRRRGKRGLRLCVMGDEPRGHVRRRRWLRRFVMRAHETRDLTRHRTLVVFETLADQIESGLALGNGADASHFTHIALGDVGGAVPGLGFIGRIDIDTSAGEPTDLLNGGALLADDNTRLRTGEWNLDDDL